MVKLTDLRVGNIISVPDCSQWTTTTETLFAVDTFSLRPKPISLTESWLKRMGFWRSNKDGRYGYVYIKRMLDYNYVIERDWGQEPSHFFGIEYLDSPRKEDIGQRFHFSFEIRHVHQLQNLYYALTGEELTIREAAPHPTALR